MTNPILFAVDVEKLGKFDIKDLRARKEKNEETIKDLKSKLPDLLKQIPTLGATASTVAVHMLLENASPLDLLGAILNAQDVVNESAALAAAFSFGVYAQKNGWFDEEKPNEPVEEEPTS